MCVDAIEARVQKCARTRECRCAFMASQSELDLNSLKGQNLCQAFVGVLRLLFISRFSNMGIRRFIRSLNCFGNSKRREKSS